MTLITMNPIEPGDAATPQLWNERFAAITKVVNGNIDGDNIKNRGIPREKIELDAIGPDELAPDTILPSHINNTWVGASSSSANIGTGWVNVFNKTITLNESAYIYVLWTSGGNANKAGDPAVEILVNNVAVENFSGQSGLELYDAALNKDFPFALSGLSAGKVSGNVNVIVRVKHSASAGWDVNNGTVRIDALSDSTFLA